RAAVHRGLGGGPLVVDRPCRAGGPSWPPRVVCPRSAVLRQTLARRRALRRWSTPLGPGVHCRRGACGGTRLRRGRGRIRRDPVYAGTDHLLGTSPSHGGRGRGGAGDSSCCRAAEPLPPPA